MAQSEHHDRRDPCPLLGVKQTSAASRLGETYAAISKFSRMAISAEFNLLLNILLQA
jgi:hypothetical protein